MFDAGRDVGFFFEESPRGKYQVPYDAGSAIGTIIWMVLKPKWDRKV